MKNLPWFLAVPLTGLGQIMFQENPVTGLLFLIGIAVASPLMAVGAVLGAVVGTATAVYLKYDPKEIRAGLYGFNSSLVGIAIYFNYPWTIFSTVVLISGAIGATVLTNVMRQGVPFPTYTAPFIVTTWLALYMLQAGGLVKTVIPPPPTALSPESALLEGLSEVMFQANNLTGILFLVGIFVSSWVGALWSLAGSFLGGLLALWHNDPVGTISLGLYGYNASLAAMALALHRRSLIFPALAALISVPITERFPATGLATLTAPFVLASWIMIALIKLDEMFYSRKEESKL